MENLSYKGSPQGLMNYLEEESRTCLNCDIKSWYSYCDKCQRLADDQENYNDSQN